MPGKIGRREAIRTGLGALLLAPGAGRAARAQVLQPEDAEKALFPAPGLPGGGQLEVRMAVSAEHPDPDVRELARRLLPYNLESYYAEWTRVAEKNQELAERFEAEKRKVTAHEFYLRAADFYRNALVYLPESDPRTLPAYHKLKLAFDKAWSLSRAPFERVEIPFEGQKLEGLFYPARGAAGQRAPVVYNYGGADGILLRGADSGATPFLARGMAYLDVDAPGHGGALRLRKLYMPPDCERIGKAVMDYLVSRPDVDPNRIALHGSSMGGYSGPRCATADPRIKAVAVWSGSFSLREDLFDYYPPIQDRVRWLIGARTLEEARKKLADYTLEGRAKLIECPLLVGYSKDDRIMDPRGALRLYQQATNAKREMLEGVGHGVRRLELRTYLADWLAQQLGTSA